MQKALKLTNNITIAIEQGHHDENLINALQQHMNSLPNTYLGTEPYYRIMMNVFQISNHPNGFEENGCLGYLPIKLKEIAVCMIINLMKYFEENGIRKVPTHVQVKGLQIMIKSMRVFIIQHEKQPLDRDQLKKLLKYQQYCKQLYSTVGNLLQQQQQQQQQQGQGQQQREQKGNNLKIKKLHYMNQLQIASYLAYYKQFNIHQCVRKMRKIYENKQKFTQNQLHYCDRVVLGILKILIRRKDSELLTIIYPHLIKSHQQLIQTIKSPQRTLEKLKHSNKTQIYSMLWKIKNNIAIRLQQVQKYVRNGMDMVFFHIIQQHNQPYLLSLWFRVINTKSMLGECISQGLRCFMKVTNKCISQFVKFTNVMQLCKQVILYLLFVQVKDTDSKQVQGVCYCLMQFIHNAISYPFPTSSSNQQFLHHTLLDIFNKFSLVCSKFAYQQLCTYTIRYQLFYQITNSVYQASTFNKFMKVYVQDDAFSQLLKCRYQLSTTTMPKSQTINIHDRITQLIIKQPQYICLFYNSPYPISDVLQVQLSRFRKMQDILQIYFILFNKYHVGQSIYYKVCEHMLHSFNVVNHKHIQNEYLQSIKQIMYANIIGNNRINSNADSSLIFGIVYLFCQCFIQQLLMSNIYIKEQQEQQLRQTKCYKLIRLVDQLYVTKQTHKVIHTIVKSLNNKVKSTIHKIEEDNNNYYRYKQEISEDMVLLIEILFTHKLVPYYHQEMDNSMANDQRKYFRVKKKLDKVSFQYFQVYNMMGRDGLLFTSFSHYYLKKCLQSNVIRQSTKVDILKLLFKHQIINEGKIPILSLQEICQIISSQLSQEELTLYISYAIRHYRSNGKQLLSVLSKDHQKIMKYLINYSHHNIEGEQLHQNRD